MAPRVSPLLTTYSFVAPAYETNGAAFLDESAAALGWTAAAPTSTLPGILIFCPTRTTSLVMLFAFLIAAIVTLNFFEIFAR